VYYCDENCRKADEIFHVFECRAYRGKNRDFIADSDCMHLMRMLAVFYYNEKIIDRLYYEVYPSLPPFCNLTPIQLFFDLVGHEEKLLEEYSASQKPVILEALSYLSYEEIICIVKNLSKYGLFDNLCTICGNLKTEMKNKNGQVRHCCLWQPTQWKTNWETTEEDWQAFLIKLLKNGKTPLKVGPVPLPILHDLLLPLLIQTQTNSDCNAHTIFRLLFWFSI
jgi:hypothetical protein